MPTDFPHPQPALSPPQDQPRGAVYVVLSYLLWGLLPLYTRMIEHIPPAEVVAHRVIWALPIAGAVLAVTGRTGELRAMLRSPRHLAMAALTASLISLNWGIYVWAVASGQTLGAALGFYIIPLFSVAMGAALLGERLSPLQGASVALALIAVAILTWDAGRLPVVALAITLTWGLYAYFKKSLPIGPNQGFFLEVLVLMPAAVLYALWAGFTGNGHFLAGSVTDTLLLIGCGPVAAVPLILFANGAKLLRLSTAGILQYIEPTIILVIAIAIFGEPFGAAERIAFPLIWVAVGLYSIALARGTRRSRMRPAG